MPKRSIWWRIHSWIGLKLSLVMIFIFLTGTLATLSSEIDWLLNPPMRAAGADQRTIRWDEMAAAAVQAVPGARLTRLSAPTHAGFAAEAQLLGASGATTRVWLDPASGRVQGVTPWLNVQQWLRQLHRRMLLPSAIGSALVSIFALPLSLMLTSGLVAYKRFWRGFFRLPRYRRAQMRQFLGDLHRFIGLWSFAFVALIAATGLVFLALAFGLQPSIPPDPVAKSFMVASPSAGRCLGHLGDDLPDLHVVAIWLPAHSGQAIHIVGAATLSDDGGEGAWIDPADCTLLRRDRAVDQSFIARFYSAATILHFGQWGGLASRLLWFLFGCALSAGAISGAWIYTARIGRERYGRDPAPSAISLWWGDLGRWRLTGIALVAALLLSAGALLGPTAFALEDWAVW
jgi:uncharacterized iron-regulated membrane protein